MTYTTYDSPASLLASPDALRSAGAAVARMLPGSGPVAPATPALLADASAPLGTPGAQAVAVSVTGAATGTVTLVVAGELATALRTGPLGAEELVSALVDPVSDAISELETVFGAALHAGVADAVIAEALDFAPDAVAVPLTDGGAPVGLLVIELAAAPVAEPARPEPAPQLADFTALVEDAAAPVTRSLDLLHDVEMVVTVELGRTRMAVRDLLSLTPGAVVELDRAAGSPVDVLVNGKLIARGEVVVIDDDFGIRISEIIGMQANRS